ncbi:unnamed protein product [Ilex paraguariensis]|uniref:Uncharacterized protein n=1 Tax=Ilex paraguariensis TaxID=185542 RepID=A0ABC8UPQ5_9AQUA
MISSSSSNRERERERAMALTWRKAYLDIVLVPIGLLIMLGYHLFLLYRVLKLPQTTVIGYENHNKRAWVERMMQVEAKDRGLALSVINSNISVAISLSSISLVLSSLIGAWIGSFSENIFTSNIIYGDTSPSTISIKYIALLSCFLISFASFVETTRCFVHANFLITMPNADIPATYVQKAVTRGSNFWAGGHRAHYFATTLLMWLFGPIPMFISVVVMVAVLHKLDTNSNPLHQYQSRQSHNLFKKIGQEITAITRTIEHEELPHGNGSRNQLSNLDNSLQL